MKQPCEPDREDCCDSGCNPCIFDVYEKQLKLYNKYLESGEIKGSHENAISQLKYTEFTVVKNLEICPSYSLICFKKISSNSKKVFWKPGDHFLIKYTSNYKSCTRPYTPIKDLEIPEGCDFSVVVKKYAQGLVSNYLCNLSIGTETLWRGPYGNYALVPSKFERIIMIAQGIGIAPFVTIINSILNDENDITKIYLNYCCSSIDCIPLRNELYKLKSFWNFKYKIFLSNLGCVNEGRKYQEPIIDHRFIVDDLTYLEPFTDYDQILLCGSTNFMDQYKKVFEGSIMSQNIVLF